MSTPVPLELPQGEHEIELYEELGRGGMGVVARARQRSLRRQVAVKRSLDADTGDSDILEEAYALAHLAHPNIVPVHALVTLDERPALVMKRVDGNPWSTLLHASPGGMPPTGELLDAHLGILLEVARAVDHAHRAGVLHLDIKPANVMLGEFGEVYLLDWGLAARLGAEPAVLPSARSIANSIGTAAYMAPEQVRGDGAAIDRRTDVYLLGATLFELLTLEPRNSVQTRVTTGATTPHVEMPTFGEALPVALVDIVYRATALDPAERYPDVPSFRDAVSAYLRDREVETLAERAREQLAELRDALDAESPDRERVLRAFGAARFAAREVGARAPEHAGLPPLLSGIFGAMARFALRDGEVDLARAYAGELRGADAELTAAIARAEDEEAMRAEHARALEELGREEDLSVQTHTRATTVFALATVFLASNLTMGALTRRGFSLGYGATLSAMVFAFAFIVPYAVVRREALFPNRVGTAIWGTSLTTLTVVIAHWAVCWALGLPFRSSLVLSPLYYMLCFGALATLFDAWLWPSAILQVPTLIAAAMFPAWAFEIIGVGTFVSLVLLGSRWWKDGG